jgi:hypothetical protein
MIRAFNSLSSHLGGTAYLCRDSLPAPVTQRYPTWADTSTGTDISTKMCVSFKNFAFAPLRIDFFLLCASREFVVKRKIPKGRE